MFVCTSLVQKKWYIIVEGICKLRIDVELESRSVSIHIIIVIVNVKHISCSINIVSKQQALVGHT